jgi:hypothetical protein
MSLRQLQITRCERELAERSVCLHLSADVPFRLSRGDRLLV